MYGRSQGNIWIKKGSLDEFLFQLKLPSELKSTSKLIFVLNHGQASVERGFNINKSVLNVNIS